MRLTLPATESRVRQGLAALEIAALLDYLRAEGYVPEKASFRAGFSETYPAFFLAGLRAGSGGATTCKPSVPWLWPRWAAYCSWQLSACWLRRSAKSPKAVT
jgi:hypothetical protein